MIGCRLGFIENSTVCIVSLELTASEYEGKKNKSWDPEMAFDLYFLSLLKILIKIGPIFHVLLH